MGTLRIAAARRAVFLIQSVMSQQPPCSKTPSSQVSSTESGGAGSAAIGTSTSPADRKARMLAARV